MSRELPLVSSIEIVRFSDPVPYAEAYELQVARRNDIESGTAKNALFLLEHTPTFTLGRSADEANLLAKPEALAEMGIEVARVDRGGDITYHGSGQLVAYPILNLEIWEKSVQWYLRKLEDVIIEVLGIYDIHGERMAEFTGVWVGGAKIAAVGIGIHQWVTYHGISINLDPNMEHWGLIVPCGIPDKPITSLRRTMEHPPTMPELMDTFEGSFSRIFAK
ncbi:MAG: lipoyl(octanoyl) transferase LipB [Candidatus Hydrogenedentota bacterium]